MKDDKTAETCKAHFDNHLTRFDKDAPAPPDTLADVRRFALAAILNGVSEDLDEIVLEFYTVQLDPAFAHLDEGAVRDVIIAAFRDAALAVSALMENTNG